MEDGRPAGRSQPAFDLFDRWLMHREEQADDDEAVKEPPTLEPQEVTDPLFDESFVTDTSEPTLQEPTSDAPVLIAPPVQDVAAQEPAPEVAVAVESMRETPARRRTAPITSNDAGRSILEALGTAPGQTRAEPEAETPGAAAPVPAIPSERVTPVTPVDFEPVIIPSARARAKAKPESRLARVARGHKRETDEPIADLTVPAAPAEVEVAEPSAPDPIVAAVEAPVVETPTAAPPVAKVRPETPKIDLVGAGREVFAAFAAAADTAAPEKLEKPPPRFGRRAKPEKTAPTAQQSQQAGTEATPDTRRAPRPVDSRTEPNAARALFASSSSPAAAKSGPAAPAQKGTEATEPEAGVASGPSGPTQPTETPQALETAATVEPTAETAAAAAAARRRATGPSAGPSTDVDFPPRNGTRRLVGLLLLVALVATAAVGYVAYEDRTTFNMGVAGTLAVLTLVIWAVRAGASTARLSVRRGQLEILKGGGRFVFDLASTYTPIEVIGEPGKRGWQVLFLRRSMSPFVIDASMVDPEEFMKVLRRFRPE